VIYVQIFENKQHVNIFLPSIANLKCTPSDRQMYPQGYIYPRLGTPGVEDTLVYNSNVLLSTDGPQCVNLCFTNKILEK